MDGTTITGAAVLPNVGPAWTRDGSTVTGAANPRNYGPGWHAAAADFSGDGKSDILWHHDILLQYDSGVPLIWTMDGTTITAAATLSNPVAFVLTQWEHPGRSRSRDFAPRSGGGGNEFRHL
jgi:hypothetical protein